MIYIGLNGIGKMGGLIAMQILNSPDYAITCAFDCSKSKLLGMDLGMFLGIEKWGVRIDELSLTSDYNINILIDFSSAHGFDDSLEYCYKKGIKFISGTTGLNKKQILKMKNYSKKIPILYSSNMSTGINTLLNMLDSAKDMLKDKSRDIEIIEYHHRNKKDSPSGTALSIAEKISSLSKKHVEKMPFDDFPRENSIRIHSIRAGNIFGIHEILLYDENEILSIKHSVNSRNAFVKGVLSALDFIKIKKNGFFSMQDVLK